MNPAKQVGKHLKPTEQVNKDRVGLICEVIKDISRRFEYVLIQLWYEFLSGEVWGWAWRRKIEQRHKTFGYLTASHGIFLLNDGRQVSRLSCCFCHLHVANLGGSCAQGRANIHGSRAGTAGGNISVQKRGRQDMQQLAVLENAA